ncbi:PLP-dependent aminotransferase family protein [uncultured Marivita sp.]|uniref:aminotransferase-like domain-containing protein n=1 Tax=uncultured Marivita sp. TaxID=888080 RepID=UPI0026392666|nr:PLP-dependent aminotransferase family protein [uncultured Marivita sp.]
MSDTISPDQIASLPQNHRGPKYRRVADAIQSAIRAGDLSVGDRLPPVRELAWSLGITPGTVARAYTLLTDAGHAVAEVGRGTFVAGRQPRAKATAREYVSIPFQDGKLSLASPQLPDLGQVALLQEAFARVGQVAPERLLQYPTREAYRPLREAAAHWLRHIPLGRIDQSDIVLVHGAQNGLGVILQTILRGPSPTILVEELAYPGFRRAADLLRADVVGLPSDENGLIPDALEAAIRETGAQVLCTSPDVHNPTLLCTPADRRQEIADICRALDVQIIEDDCYRRIENAAPSYRILAPERTWHVASISKVLTPALRLGFAIAPRGRGAELRQTAEHGFFGLAQPLAEVAEHVLTSPETETIVAAIRDRMAAYVRVAVNALGSYDLTWQEDVPFLWLHLPQGWRAALFCRAAEARDIQIRSADEFALRDGRAPHAVRIAVNAQIPLHRFENAMHQLRDLLMHPPEQISV